MPKPTASTDSKKRGQSRPDVRWRLKMDGCSPSFRENKETFVLSLLFPLVFAVDTWMWGTMCETQDSDASAQTSFPLLTTVSEDLLNNASRCFFFTMTTVLQGGDDLLSPCRCFTPVKRCSMSLLWFHLMRLCTTS